MKCGYLSLFKFMKYLLFKINKCKLYLKSSQGSSKIQEPPGLIWIFVVSIDQARLG